MERRILGCVILAVGALILAPARPVVGTAVSTAPFATSTATLTLTFTAASSGAADTKRDAALLDYAKAQGLDIYQSDGVTVDTSKVSPAVRTFIANQLRDTVIQYRGSTSAASTRATELASLGSL